MENKKCDQTSILKYLASTRRWASASQIAVEIGDHNKEKVRRKLLQLFKFDLIERMKNPDIIYHEYIYRIK